KQVLGILLTGRRLQDWRSPKKDTVDFFDLKGLIENIFAGLHVKADFQEAKVPAMDPLSSAQVLIGPELAGFWGKVDKKVLSNWDIKNQDIYFAQMDLDKVLSLPFKALHYESIPEFPAIVRDVSLAVQKGVSYKKIQEICFAQGQGFLTSVQLIEEYLGEK